MHFDSYEAGSDVHAKQIALEKLEGYSIGKLRSYIWGNPPYFVGFYPNDFFFAWGDHSSLQLKKSYNCIKHIIKTGIIYPSENEDIKNEIKSIKEYFHATKVKFKILLIDFYQAVQKAANQLFLV